MGQRGVGTKADIAARGCIQACQMAALAPVCIGAQQQPAEPARGAAQRRQDKPGGPAA